MAPKTAFSNLDLAQVPALRACFAPQRLCVLYMQGDGPQGTTEVTRGAALPAREQARFSLFKLFFVHLVPKLPISLCGSHLSG